MIHLSPSILSADFANLQRDIELTTKSGATYIHIDVMDGHFVPNITIGSDVLKSINNFSNEILDVHLMISDPTKYLDDFINAGADIITIHYESTNNLIELIDKIKFSGKKACISINPETDVTVLDDFLPFLDMVLIMSVKPGFGGQKFMPNALDKIRYVKQKAIENNYNLDIEVDGGINFTNISDILSAGANIIVAGSSVFNGDIVKNTKDFIEIFNSCKVN